MPKREFQIQGMGYVPGVARGVLHRGSAGAGAIALVGQREAISLAARPEGLVVVDGAPLSHGAIGLMGLGIPTVLISGFQAQRLDPGVELWVDGASGLISSAAPTAQQSQALPVPVPEAGQPVRLADGTPVSLMASVRSAAEAGRAVRRGATAIGLVRSEFLGRDEEVPPDARYFTRELEALCHDAKPLVITLRLLDLAADKPPRWLPDAERLLRPLGMQGARLFASEPVGAVLRAQLEAVTALSDRFEIDVLVPYLGRGEEMRHWTGFVRKSLPPGIAVGAMVETPAAVLDLSNWCEETDFVALGCNDLMQCLFGADRDEPALRSCLDPYAPVLYRFLAQSAGAAREHLDRVRLCGVLPRLAGALPVLVGLGFRGFSVDSAWIPYLAKGLGSQTVEDAADLARQVCACRDSRRVREVLGLPFEETA